MSHKIVAALTAERLSAFLKRPFTAATILALILLLAFHRPVLRSALKGILRTVAAREGLSLQVKISGNPLSTPYFEDLLVQPAKKEHPTVDVIKITKAKITYSPLSLLLKGPTHCLRRLSAEGVRICLHTNEDPKAKKEVHLRHQLGGILAVPEIAPESLTVKQFEVEVAKNGESVFVLREGFLDTQPGREGMLRVGFLQIAGHTPIRGIETMLACTDSTWTLRDLELTPALAVASLKVGSGSNALRKHELVFALRGGEGELKGKIQTTEDQNPWSATLEARNFSTAAVADFGGGELKSLPENLSGTVEITGNPALPHSWTGAAHCDWKTAVFKGPSAAVSVDAKLLKGEFSLTSLSVKTESSEAVCSGRILLPNNHFSIQTCSGTLSVQASSRELNEWLPKPNSAHSAGGAEADAKIHLNRGVVQLEFQGNAKKVDSSYGKAEDIHAEATFSMPVGNGFDLKHIAGNALLSFQKPAFETPAFQATLGEGVSALTVSDGSVRFWNLQLKDASNTVAGEFSFPLIKEAPPARAHLEFHFQNLGSTAASIRGYPLKGVLQGTLAGALEKGVPQGKCVLAGGSLGWGNFQLEDIHVQAESQNGTLVLTDLSLAWSPREWMRAAGKISLASPYAYEIDATAQMPRLDRTGSFLKQLGWVQQISGALEAKMQGQGELETLTGTGSWNLKLKEARWDNLHFNTVECAGLYRPGQLIADPLRLTSRDTKFRAHVEWRENILRIEDINLEQWGTPTLSGYLLLPLTHDAQGTHWVKEARVAGQLRADKLDIANLYAGAGKSPDFTGTVQCSLALSGTPEKPSAAFNVRATDVRTKGTPRFGAAILELKGSYQEDTLQAEAKLLSAMKAPLFVEARIPLPLESLFSSPVEFRRLPMTAHIHTTGATLSPLADLWPGLRQINGTASLDATLKGALESPHWSAKLNADCPIVHFASDRVPAISELHLGLDLDDKHLHLRTLKAELGGGSLDVQGDATFDTPNNPTLNFTAKAREILAVRNRSLSLRLNGNLFLRGPWKRAVIGGTAATVKSRVQWDLELLPLTALLPGFHKEQRTAGKPWFTLTRAPFSDWKFDVALSTTPGDPIVLRGNRLRGTAEAELRLEGTGATPTLHGAYRTNDLVTTLPFARIEMSRGRVWYTREQPFLPQLDFTAETEVRNYRIRLYLGGAAEAPQISISSEPPLSETDLLTLVTTGALPSDAAENAQALAGRAATVLFQEFSHKVLKPGLGQEPFSALRRFSLDLSAVNGRTGHQETRLTYRLTDNFFAIGEIGADGDFAGRFRYVLRFR